MFQKKFFTEKMFSFSCFLRVFLRLKLDQIHEFQNIKFHMISLPLSLPCVPFSPSFSLSLLLSLSLSLSISLPLYGSLSYLTLSFPLSFFLTITKSQEVYICVLYHLHTTVWKFGKRTLKIIWCAIMECICKLT